jgi:hypothetical protein
MKTYWFLALMSAICLEGLGRKYLPWISPVAFYFVKDVVLLAGYLLFKPSKEIGLVWKRLYNGFGVVWIAAFAWTLFEMINPENQSYALGLIGLRAYWLWWLTPLVIAGVLQDPREKRRAIVVLAVLAIGISIFAMIQFASPPTADVNLYSVVDGEAQYADSAVVTTTGRARVSSTFSFLSGFADFTVLVPTLLLSLGLGTQDPRVRRIALPATLLSAAVVPMSGARSSVILSLAVLGLTSWSTGLFTTAVGRRVLVGAIASAALATMAFPEALQGVQDRFAMADETNERLVQSLLVVPPVALMMADYPVMGIGTGMQQNARGSLHIYTRWATENENHRYLVELGPVGFLLIWTVKLGLMIALLRARRILKVAGRLAASGAALAYAAIAFMGNLTFDHIWQSLYFVGVGFILAEVVDALKTGPAHRTDLAVAD